MKFALWLVAAVVVASLAAAGYLSAAAQDACLSIGYPQSTSTLDGTIYCLATVDGTSVVVPLEKAHPIKVVVR